jgi:hypothetical protein
MESRSLYLFYKLQSLVNFGAPEWWFSYFTNLVQFGEIRNLSVMGRAMNGAAQVLVQTRSTFKTPIEAHPLVAQEQGKPVHLDGSPVQLDAGIRC